MDFDEIFRKCPKWDKEQVIRFGSDLNHCLDHLDPSFFKGSYSKIILRWILMIFLGYVRNGKRKKWLDFRRDPDHHLDLVDPGSF